jgi:hypothetical protein
MMAQSYILPYRVLWTIEIETLENYEKCAICMDTAKMSLVFINT